MNLSRFMFYRSIRVGALVTLTFAQLLSATGVRAQVTHTVIAASGDAAPAGGNYTVLPDAPVLNVRGQMAFDAVLGGPSTRGVFLSDGMTTLPIALSGNPDPAAGNFEFVSTPFLTDRGDVIFSSGSGFFLGDGKRTVPLVQSGDPAPGGGSLILGPYAANSRGLIAFQSFVTGGVSSEGIFRNDGTHTTAIALEGTPSPTGGTFLFFSAPVIDDGDEVAFFAGMTGGSADFGLYRGDGENITTIFAANQAAPGGGTFLDFGDPRFNKHGQVLAQAQLENAAGPSGLFLHDGKDAIAIAVSGEAAPKGGTYSTFFGPQILNDHGQVAFAPLLTGGTSRRGIFRGDGSTTTTIALEGTTAPGTTGTFASFVDMKMGNDGTVAFIATLTVGAGGVDLTNNIGIWAGTSETDLHLVARSGELIEGKTLTRPLSLSRLEIKGRPIVWLGRFSGNSTAIVSSDFHAGSDD